MPGWIQRIDEKTGKSVFIPKGDSTPVLHSAAVVPDIPDYESPVTGKPVSGRRQRREDLKRNGCVEYDPGMKQTALQVKEDRLNRTTESMVERMRWVGA